jgi:hypothetical protein
MAEVELHFDSMRHLHAELAPMLSNDGLFILSEDPHETDTVVRFRVTLPEGFVLIEGTGIVIWARSPFEEGGPAGMAVRYASLSREAQETIDAIIDAHLASGGSLFNLDPAGDPQPSIPTDALDHESLGSVRDRESAKAATARQLEQARLTIRDALQDTEDVEAPGTEEEPIADIEDQYLASVEAQVEEAVAGIRESVVDSASDRDEPADDQEAAVAGIRESAGDAAAEGAESVADEVAAVTEVQQLELQVPQASELDPGVEAEGFEPPEIEIEVMETEFQAEDEPSALEGTLSEVQAEEVEPEVVTEEDRSDLERIRSEVESSLTLEPQSPPPSADVSESEVDEAPAVQGDAAPEGTETEVIESVIPVFLERWKEEIGAEEVERSAETPPETPVPGVEQDTQPATSSEAPEAPRMAVDEPEEQPVLEAEPVAEPATSFEVSVVDEGPVHDETPVLDPAADQADVMLAPTESVRPSGRRLMWGLLVVLVPVVGLGGYFGWDWYQGRSDSTPPAESAAAVQLDRELAPVGQPEHQPDDQLPAELPPDAQPDQRSTEDLMPVTNEDELEAPPQEPTAVPPLELPTEPATMVESIEWQIAGGATEVVIRGNGLIAEDSVSVFPMRNPDRILVRLRRIEEQYRAYEIPVGSAEVNRIRTGHHPEQKPPALYVVLDLANPLVGVADFRADGNTLRVTVEAQ